MDQRFALIACVLANIHRGEDQEPFDPRDFMPLTEKEREQLEADKIRQNHERIAEFLKANA